MDRKLILAIIVLVLAAIGGVFWAQTTKVNTSPQNTPKNVNVPENSTPELKPILYYYPISDYNNRIKYRWFGKYVTANDIVPDCGRTFIGFHDGDDLEVTATEKNVDVPIKAFADGKIRLAEHIDGYGGLIIEEVKINDQTYLINYGHIRLASTKLKVGDNISAGSQIAILGTGCSSETDGERKHLHFAVHKGSTIDIRGYIPTEADLNANWVNPKDFLQSLNAK